MLKIVLCDQQSKNPRNKENRQIFIFQEPELENVEQFRMINDLLIN